MIRHCKYPLSICVRSLLSIIYINLYLYREEDEVVPPILEGVLNQPDAVHLQVAFTSVQLLGELNEWVACHPAFLPHVLQFLTKRLHNKHLATVAAKVRIL